MVYFVLAALFSLVIFVLMGLSLLGGFLAIPIVIFAGHRIYLLLQRRRMLKQAARYTAEVSDIRSVWLDQPGQPLYYQEFALRYEGRNGVLYRAYFAY